MIYWEGVKKITKIYIYQYPSKGNLTPPLSAHLERDSDIWTYKGLNI